ncbi:MAG: class I SAM-dependent methyltransferase [Anaerolineales bacterium]|nr:class I SAM-dependent methyltransferase [Anaerolineales bacterium]
MNSATAERLLAINREFYNRFGKSFSATRQRLQPGVKKILNSIQDDDSVLDLGCGNGIFLREISRRGHKQPLLGVDFNLPLLRNAESAPEVIFREVDLTQLSANSEQLLTAPAALLGGGDAALNEKSGGWSVITMFAALHHIPSNEIRLDILRTVQKLLKPNGKFILSNWQFLNSEKLKARIQPWDMVGLSSSDVDEGDYLLDWRSGGQGLRYAHHFSVEELLGLAKQAGMSVSDSFLSDGENDRLGLYQVWSGS